MLGEVSPGQPSLCAFVVEREPKSTKGLGRNPSLLLQLALALAVMGIRSRFWNTVAWGRYIRTKARVVRERYVSIEPLGVIGRVRR